MSVETRASQGRHRQRGTSAQREVDPPHPGGGWAFLRTVASVRPNVSPIKRAGVFPSATSAVVRGCEALGRVRADAASDGGPPNAPLRLGRTTGAQNVGVSINLVLIVIAVLRPGWTDRLG